MSTRLQLSVILTDECNMRCRYCTTAKRPVDASEHVLDRIAALLERFEGDLDVNFHGGEPTMVWDAVLGLDERLTHLEAARPERRVTRSICTNGTFLDAERARFLAERDFNVRLSIDGSRESHTLYRFPRGGRKAEPSAESYEQTVEGLRLLVAAGAHTAANMVVTPATVDRLARNAVFLIKHGLVHLVISPVVGMPWQDEQLLILDQQLLQVQEVWRHWMQRKPQRMHENLRRAFLSEIDRATYCIGERMNQPDAKVLVIGPDGRIFGDEPEARTEDALLIGHVDEVEDLAELPPLPRTAFQLMYDREFYAPEVLRDVRRTHRLLRRRMSQMYRTLFGPLPEESASAPPA